MLVLRDVTLRMEVINLKKIYISHREKKGDSLNCFFKVLVL